MKKFIYNDCNVVLNPDVLFSFKPKGALAWCYWELKIGKCMNGLWDFGYWLPASVSPCCHGRYETEEEAKKYAIKLFKEWFKKDFDRKDMYSQKLFKAAKNQFLMYLRSELNKLPSQTEHIKTVVDTGTNYTQGSFF